MKTMKKVALMLCAVLAIGMMAGCGSFDASAYVKAVLDNSYKNDSTGYVDQKIATKEEAEEIYNQGLDQELDALISLAYNIGTQSLLQSTLFNNILNGNADAATISDSFLMWNKCNKVVWDGLTRRRKSEAKLFLNSDYTGNI